MEVSQYIDQKKEIQSHLLNFIDSEEKFDSEYEQLINFLNSINIQSNDKEFLMFLYLISRVSSNHHRSNNFFTKIEKVISYFEKEIKQFFTKSQIFDIFRCNKRILLFLLENNYLELDSELQNLLGSYYQKDDQVELNLFKENQKIGENESVLCQYIRKDLAEDFISYVQRSMTSLKSEVKHSNFETNPLLIKNKVTLIEYAAFYGSITIFNYLRLNNVPLKPSLWLFAIHSNNAELIHLLEEYNVGLPGNSFLLCLKEAIKCHHNEIANYFLNNKIMESEAFLNFKDNIIAYCYHYHNYEFFPTIFDYQYTAVYLCKYNYYKLVELFLDNKEFDFNSKISLIDDKKEILIYFFFNKNEILI
ncbi:hypothetical protein M9Y10_031831 [Tritrichomonas musculus]|uniref:DUF3447 domain-containing protein n=1 Tax=Tritrichomonas musculus TaxID=1915356 RepID=A0ABR2H0K7_9EUKA